MGWSRIAALLLLIAVGLGAFGAHGLRPLLDEHSRETYETGVIYHFFHALGLLVIPLFVRNGMLDEKRAEWVCRLLTLGIVLFSGSLYLLAVSRNPQLGIITPFGGVAFLAAWTVLAVSLKQQ